MSNNIGIGIAHVKTEHGVRMYSTRVVYDWVNDSIKIGDFFMKKAMGMRKDYGKSEELILKTQESYDKALFRLMETEKEITERTKIISGNIRKTADKMYEGLQRIEKQANFEKLAGYVALLERAEAAMSSLATLEQQGKLAKIMDSLK